MTPRAGVPLEEQIAHVAYLLVYSDGKCSSDPIECQKAILASLQILARARAIAAEQTGMENRSGIEVMIELQRLRKALLLTDSGDKPA